MMQRQFRRTFARFVLSLALAPAASAQSSKPMAEYERVVQEWIKIGVEIENAEAAQARAEGDRTDKLEVERSKYEAKIASLNSDIEAGQIQDGVPEPCCMRR